MIPGLELRSRLPLSANAKRLLAVIDGLPVQEPERARILTALGLIENEAWSRVEVRADGDPREVLRLGAEWATPNDLANVLELADTVARAFDFDSVGTQHIALAVVASARLDADRRGTFLEVVSEAFSVGTLEGLDQVVGVHLRRRASSEMTDEDSAQLQMTLANPWWFLRRAAPLIHPILRLMLVVGLIVIAVGTQDLGAWLIAFAAAVPFRDPKLVDWPDAPRYPRGIPVAIPSLLVLSGIAAVLGQLATAIVLLIAHVLFEAIGIFLDRVVYMHLLVEGKALDGIQGYRQLIGRALGQIYRGSFRSRYLRWLLPLVPVALVALRWNELLFLPTLKIVQAQVPAEVLRSNPEGVIRVVLGQTVLAGVMFAVMLLLSASGHFLLAILTAVLVVAVRGWNPMVPGVVVLLGAAIFLFDWFAWRRIPSGRFPVRLFLPRRRPIEGLLVQIEIRRRLRLGRPLAALDLYEEWLASLPSETRAVASQAQMVHAHLLLEAGRPGEAWDLRHSFPRNADVFGSYVVARTLFLLSRFEDAHRSALELSNRMATSTIGLSKGLRVVVALTIMEILAHATPEDGVGLTILARISDMADGGRVQEPVRMLRYAAVAFAPTRPVLAERCALGASGLALLAQNERATGRERNRESTLMVEGATAASQATRYMFGNGESTVESWSSWRTGAEILFRNGSPVQIGYELRSMATLLDSAPGFGQAAYRARLDLVGIMNTVRHELRTREDRLAWWATFRDQLDDAIHRSFKGKDWATLAELIEYGRLQSESSQSAMYSLRKPLFVRVSGRSVLQDGFWEKAGEPAPAYDLEDAAAVVGGPTAWWWSTWETRAHMYWALVRPGEPAMGGRVAMDELAPPLARLRDAVPVELPGEPAELRARRLADSALLHGSIAREREISRDLANLLPTPVKLAILNAPAPVPLAIAPDVAFAHVPWAAVILDGQDKRFVELAQITIAPPVAALAEIVARPQDFGDGGDSIRLAVLDPGGDLPGAAALISELPEASKVLAAVNRPAATQVEEALVALPRDATWLFAGHTASIPPDGRAGLSLLAKARYEPAYTISGDSLPALPRAVVLLACDSGDLSNAAAGEWSTLGPAMLRAGADRVLVTAFPIRDASSVDREIIAKVAQFPLGQALRQAQLNQLQIWRDTRGRHSPPADWGGHMLIGATDGKWPLPSHLGPSQVWVASAVFDLIDAAAIVAADAGSSSVRIEDIWVAVLEWGWETIGRPTDALFRSVAWATRVRRSRNSMSGSTIGVDLSRDVEELVAEAVHLSRALHHRIMLDDHIVATCLARSDLTARFVRAATGLDPRSADGAAFMTERNEAGWNRTGVPTVSALSQNAVNQIFEIVGAQPAPEERWYDSDR